MSINRSIIIAFCLLYSMGSLAEDDDTKPVTRREFQDGQLVREKQEVEVYDYHSGSYFSVFVYRETDQAKPESESKNQPTLQQKP